MSPLSRRVLPSSDIELLPDALCRYDGDAPTEA